MNNLAIIPARGGSKRLPRKNILPFAGKPMMIWTAEAARESQQFSRIIISTEDDEIASIAEQFGFEVSLRPPHLATDLATCVDVCTDILTRFEQENSTFDTLCCLYATAPLRTADDIVATLALLGDEQTNLADFSMAVTNYRFPPYQALMKDKGGNFAAIFPLLQPQKSQHLPMPYIDNGSTYAVRVPAFLQYRSFLGPRTVGHLMPFLRSIDIDTQEDYELASFAAELHRGKSVCQK